MYKGVCKLMAMITVLVGWRGKSPHPISDTYLATNVIVVRCGINRSCDALHVTNNLLCTLNFYSANIGCMERSLLDIIDLKSRHSCELLGLTYRHGYNFHITHLLNGTMDFYRRCHEVSLPESLFLRKKEMVSSCLRSRAVTRALIGREHLSQRFSWQRSSATRALL